MEQEGGPDERATGALRGSVASGRRKAVGSDRPLAGHPSSAEAQRARTTSPAFFPVAGSAAPRAPSAAVRFCRGTDRPRLLSPPPCVALVLRPICFVAHGGRAVVLTCVFLYRSETRASKQAMRATLREGVRVENVTQAGAGGFPKHGSTHVGGVVYGLKG